MTTTYITSTTNDKAKLILSETTTSGGPDVVRAVVESLRAQGHRVLVREEGEVFVEVK